jgi:hypothetical protein
MNEADLEAQIDLRDYFAAAALTGLCAQSDAPFHENVAKQAWLIADMMMAQREVQP